MGGGGWGGGEEKGRVGKRIERGERERGLSQSCW